MDIKLEVVVLPVGYVDRAKDFYQELGPGRDLDGKSYSSFAAFTDPDGNGRVLQEITTRLPGQ